MSCSFSQKIKNGEMAYERKQYAVATEMLAKEFAKSSVPRAKARLAYLTGLSHYKLLEYKLAKKWLAEAVQLEYGSEALTHYAKVSKNLQEYTDAISAYEQIGKITGRNQETDREIQICRMAMEAITNPEPYTIEKVSQNSAVSEYSPIIYDNVYLVFTSERRASTGSRVYKWTGEKFSDIFIMMKSGSEVRNFDSAINTEHNEGTPCFTKDMNTMYFTRCFSQAGGDARCKLMVSHKVDGFWSEPAVLPFVTEEANYGQPALLEQDSVLVFVSDRDNPGGSTDLYYSEFSERNGWSAPMPFPSSVNSPGNEKFPSTDGDTLYFSSDYWPGMGGYDIFKTYLKADGSWTSPINMQYPINSGADDFSFVIDYGAKSRPNVLREGFFVSSRDGDNTKDDIYRFQHLNKPKNDTQIEVPEKKKSVFVTVNTLTPVYKVADDPNSGMIDKVILGDCIINITDQRGNKLASGYSDGNGFYFKEIPLDTELKITAAKLGYLNAVEALSTMNIIFDKQEDAKTFNLRLVLDKIYENKEINLPDIYYDYDKWDIKQAAMPTLDKLVKLMQDNPQIKIQLSSHTDCRGDAAYNMELSQKRAQSAVDYLIAKGIPQHKLVAKGYGETALLIRCVCEACTEAEHQINRRTTFKIVK